MIRMSAVERTRLERLLGEPLMADDPLIDVRQAAAVLGVSRATVRDLLTAGVLPRHGPAEGGPAVRQLLLSEVLDWAALPSRITVGEAATLLGESVASVHRLVGVGLLSWQGGRWPLSRAGVEDLAIRRRHWLTLAEAAKAAQVPAEEIHHRLGDQLLNHTGDVSRPVDGAQLDVSPR
jgi:predicted DNA-binding transcriptional regulator AlpA